MSELKTKPTKKSALEFIKSVPNPKRCADALIILKLFKKATGLAPRMWGGSIIGFGTYHYKSKSGREGDWPQTGFSPRKQNLAVYIMPGFKSYDRLMSKLGKYKTGVGCLYINKLEDIDLSVLEELIRRSAADIKKMYNQ